MGALGDLLELVLVGPQSLDSFEARARTHVGGEERDALVWWAGERVREEIRDREGELVRLGVHDGADWWIWEVGRRVARTNTLGDRASGFGVAGAAPLILGQGRLVFSPRVELLGREDVAGRRAVRVRLPDREIWIDEEHGTALRAVFGEKLLLDVVEIVYGAPVDDGRFQLGSLPSEVDVRAASDLYDEAPLAQIAGMVDFPVFAPREVQVAWPAFDASRHRGDARRPERVYVSLRKRPIWIAHSQSPDPDSIGAVRTKPGDWRPLSPDGLELEVCETPPMVRLVRDGVRLEIDGEGENLEQLIAIARSLEPVTPA